MFLFLLKKDYQPNDSLLCIIFYQINLMYSVKYNFTFRITRISTDNRVWIFKIIFYFYCISIVRIVKFCGKF